MEEAVGGTDDVLVRVQIQNVCTRQATEDRRVTERERERERERRGIHCWEDRSSEDGRQITREREREREKEQEKKRTHTARYTLGRRRSFAVPPN